MPLRIEELLTPEAFPHAVASIRLRETHISWVILTGRFAYKIKKPVKFPFIDASTLERRRTYCDEELRLNRRLAPDLYVDVVPISRVGDRLVVANGDAPAIEYAVRMQQFDADDQLPSLLERNDISVTETAALGELLGAFHLQVGLWTGAPDRTERIYAAALGNLAQLIAYPELSGPCGRLDRLVAWTHDRTRALAQFFQRRERSGFIRECHGDLHAANIVRWQNRLVPFDCVEFDPQLRWIDVIDDIAFLVMDLASRRREDLAFTLLSRYLEITGDYEGVRLLPFYAVYRSLVRAKVDALTAEKIPARAAQSRERMQWRVRSASRWIEPATPALILMHGVSGSGKSWLSERLVPVLRAVRIRSDLERKRLAGMSAAESARAAVHEDVYSPAFSRRTYGRLADCAESCLQAGINVIVDATLLEPEARELFITLATRLSTPYLIVSCEARTAALRARITARSLARNDPSDADLAVLDAQLHNMQPFSGSQIPHLTRIDTSKDGAVETVRSAVAQRLKPSGLPAMGGG